jgi:hypothetical protein
MKISNYKSEITSFILGIILTLIVLVLKDVKAWNKKSSPLNGASNNSLNGFFTVNSIKDLDDLKRQYRKLSMIYHPDKGGSVEQMQELNDEYDKLRTKLKHGANLSEEESRLEDELDQVYKDVIAALVIMPNIEIELIGKWIWISGDTFPIKDMIKELGFKFAGNKKMWYWHAQDDYKKKSKQKYSIDEIRDMYKNEKIQNKYASRVLNGLYSNMGYLQGLLNYRNNA